MWCPYCRRARALLERLGIGYRDIDVADPAKRREMIVRAQGRRTVPQIFIGGQPIGGCDDLHALAAAGKLDRLIWRDGSESIPMVLDREGPRTSISPTPGSESVHVGESGIGRLLAQLRARIKRG